MSRSSLLILLGVLIVLAPISGLPSSWLALLIPLFGILVCVVGFSVRAAGIRAAIQTQKEGNPTLVEADTPPSHHGVSPI